MKYATLILGQQIILKRYLEYTFSLYIYVTLFKKMFLELLCGESCEVCNDYQNIKYSLYKGRMLNQLGFICKQAIEGHIAPYSLRNCLTLLVLLSAARWRNKDKAYKGTESPALQQHESRLAASLAWEDRDMVQVPHSSHSQDLLDERCCQLLMLGYNYT